MSVSTSTSNRNFIKPPLSKNEACLLCKSRKVKCGAQKPRCHTCIRYAVSKNQDPCSFACEYPEPLAHRESKKGKKKSIKDEEIDGAGGGNGRLTGREEREERIRKMEEKLWELERLIVQDVPLALHSPVQPATRVPSSNLSNVSRPTPPSLTLLPQLQQLQHLRSQLPNHQSPQRTPNPTSPGLSFSFVPQTTTPDKISATSPSNPTAISHNSLQVLEELMLLERRLSGQGNDTFSGSNFPLPRRHSTVSSTSSSTSGSVSEVSSPNPSPVNEPSKSLGGSPPDTIVEEAESFEGEMLGSDTMGFIPGFTGWAGGSEGIWDSLGLMNGIETGVNNGVEFTFEGSELERNFGFGRPEDKDWNW